MIDIDILGTDSPAPSSAADTNWAPAQVALEQAMAAAINTNGDDIDALEAGSNWTLETPLNSWANIGGTDMPLATCYTPQGDVFIRGELDSGTPGTVCLELSPAYAPSGGGLGVTGKTQRFLCSCDAGFVTVTVGFNVAVTEITIGTTGTGNPGTRTSLNLHWNTKVAA